jgi:hypothetical protein
MRFFTVNSDYLPFIADLYGSKLSITHYSYSEKIYGRWSRLNVVKSGIDCTLCVAPASDITSPHLLSK